MDIDGIEARKKRWADSIPATMELDEFPIQTMEGWCMDSLVEWRFGHHRRLYRISFDPRSMQMSVRYLGDKDVRDE